MSEETTATEQVEQDSSTESPVEETITSSAPQDEAKFTQAQLNNYLKAEKKKWEKKTQNLKQDVLSELGLQNSEDIEKLNDLRSRLENEEKDKLEAKGKFDEILQRNEKKAAAREQELLTKLSSVSSDYDSYRKRVNLTDAALKSNADPKNIDMIVNFIEKDISFTEDGSMQVVDYDNQPRLDPDTGKEISIEQHIKSFLADRPSLIKGAATAGAGSTGSQQHAGLTLDKLRDLAVENPDEYAKLRADGTVQRVISETQK